jgi:hypothetical protein
MARFEKVSARASWGYTAALVLVVLGFYGAALFTPAVVDDDGNMPGLGALVLGWMWDRSVYAWSANLFLLFGVLCLLSRRFGLASVIGYAAAALALTSWFINRRLLIGYYLWQVSLFSLALGAQWAYLRFRPTPVGLREHDHGRQNRLDVPPQGLNRLPEGSGVP